ncbi:MAG TPA: hypothetical protein VH640_18085 [Bryobacteraceae bacterium]|jgi:hypothetical protein
MSNSPATTRQTSEELQLKRLHSCRLDAYPHSEIMQVEERYQPVDRDTLRFSLKIDDPRAYTKPWIALPRVFKLRPRAEIRQGYCVASEENAFTKRIREPGALPGPGNPGK